MKKIRTAFFLLTLSSLSAHAGGGNGTPSSTVFDNAIVQSAGGGVGFVEGGEIKGPNVTVAGYGTSGVQVALNSGGSAS
jgi:hypothetical protein